MQIVCPKCTTRFSFDEARITGQGLNLRCGKCKAVFKVMRKSDHVGVSSEPLSAAAGKRAGVIVANESPAFCSAVQTLLAGESFDVQVFHDGREALRAIEAHKPAAVLLDVALPSMYGFEICEAVRRNKDLDSVKLILVASIYDKTKYKRTPSSLYGADAYIEKHHIPDSLAALVNKLIAGGCSEGASCPEAATELQAPLTGNVIAESVSTIAEEATREELRRDEEQVTTVPHVSSTGFSPSELSDFSVKAQRLARIIVSDILLYNQDKVIEGIRNGNFHDLLKDEIREGKMLYARRVPAEVSDGSRFLNDAFDQLISSKRREMGLQPSGLP